MSRAKLLLQPQEQAIEEGRPYLRSGLYAANKWSNQTDLPEKIYVIYWPEDTTWDDNASAEVFRNRVTFMR